jgi:hypothetical protein
MNLCLLLFDIYNIDNFQSLLSLTDIPANAAIKGMPNVVEVRVPLLTFHFL